MNIPQLETDRLILRAMTRADFPDFAALWAMPAMTRYNRPGPRDETASWRSFLANAGSWAMDGIGQWAICWRDTGAFIGQVGFFDARRGLGVDFDAVPECGWAVAPSAQGQGVATEACVAAFAWMDARVGETVVMIAAGNVESERLAMRLGYRQFRVMTLDDVAMGLSRRKR
ncbi:MAG: GNAT family N-acetyltransferase [Rhodobacteraceae bacterium]|nr:GNAT family N-acetyltransferase [Paracoccaceae bacterium]